MPRTKRAVATQTPYDRVRGLIVRGVIPAGARLVELDVAERLGISRTPAREAIQRLHQDGLLMPTKAGPRTQFVVTPLTLDDMTDLYAIMAALEGTSARRVGTLGKPARRELGARIKEANDRFVAIGKQKNHDYNKLFELHNQFHEVLVEATGTPILRSLIDRIRPHVDRYEYMYAPAVGPDYSATFAEHAEIVRAVRDGTGASAEAAVRANWLNGADRLQSAMRRSGPRGTW